MKRTVIAGLTALALMAPSLSHAQQTAPEETAKHEHHHMSAADMKALTDARIAALKVGLQLTPDQEKNWPPVEQAVRAMAQDREARMAEWREHGKSEDAIAKLRMRSDGMAQRAVGLKKLADAAEPLYRSLTDDQKHRLHLLVHMVMGHHHGWRHRG